MLLRNKTLLFMSSITAIAAILSLGANTYMYMTSLKFAPFSALLCVMGVFASYSLFKARVFARYLVLLFWLCQILVVGVNGQKFGFLFALAMSFHFNRTTQVYVVVNVLGVILASICIFQIKKEAQVN